MARERDIKDLEKTCEDLEREVYQLQEEVEDRPWMARNLEMAENVYRTAHSELQTVQNFDHHFGTVFATSGCKISRRLGCSLDWALVDVRNTRQGENRVPQLPRKPWEFEYLSEGNAVVDVAPLSMDDNVIKSGYSSGTTYGRVSHIKHDCNVPGNSLPTSEYVVVGNKGRPFAFQGDSGAFVLDGHGRLVGLLIAGQEELGTVYVTPITEVAQDILDVTGHEVTLP
ncbi:MAG: hypothetical protein M1813_005365 [Trichoglossum hirsutum]|nr:MAG: hypothetical protein M1813_005365 [Trichoglossum hirsutum]